MARFRASFRITIVHAELHSQVSLCLNSLKLVYQVDHDVALIQLSHVSARLLHVTHDFHRLLIFNFIAIHGELHVSNQLHVEGLDLGPVSCGGISRFHDLFLTVSVVIGHNRFGILAVL